MGKKRQQKIYKTQTTQPTSNKKVGKKEDTKQGSLNYLFGGDQTMQMYGEFEGFPL